MSNYFADKMRLEGPESPSHETVCRGGDTEEFDCEEPAEHECEQPLCRKPLCIDHQQQCAVCGRSFCHEHTRTWNRMPHCLACYATRSLLPVPMMVALRLQMDELSRQTAQIVQAVRAL